MGSKALAYKLEEFGPKIFDIEGTKYMVSIKNPHLPTIEDYKYISPTKNNLIIGDLCIEEILKKEIKWWKIFKSGDRKDKRELIGIENINLTPKSIYGLLRNIRNYNEYIGVEKSISAIVLKKLLSEPYKEYQDKSKNLKGKDPFD